MKFRRSYKTVILASLLALLGLSCGSVYYNTFYNAKKNFNQAERSRKAGKNARVDAGAYRIAIEKSLKVVENHPNSKYYDDALFVLGVSYYHIGVYDKAERRFREILANYEESEYAKESTVYLAKAKLQLGDIDDAMTAFEDIFASDYSREQRSEAAMSLGEYYFEKKQFDLAESYLQAVRDSLGDDFSRKKAQLLIADGRFTSFKFDDALGSYLQLLGMEPDNDEKYIALYQSAICSYRLQRISDGLDYLQQLIDDEIYFDSLGSLRLRVAEGYEYLDELELAADAYQNVAQTATKPQTAAEAYYRLGLIYQYDFDDLIEAKRFYDLTVEKQRTTEAGQDALQRSSDIGKLETFARTAELDSTATQDVIDNAGYTQYLLAELYWFKLNKPDTAMIEMQYVVDSFPTAYETPNAMIALSQMYREHRQDTVVADSLLREVLVRYPHSDYVVEAIDQLGLAGTEADTGYAEVYIQRAENFLIDQEEVDSARHYYQYVVDNFPDSKYWLQATFNLIWLTENYASPGDSSVYYAYKEFADSFPSSPLANEARMRLTARPATPVQRPEVTQEEDLAEMSDKERIIEERRRQREDARDEDELGGYGDALASMYVRPNGDTIILLELDPIETIEQFEFPVEAAGMPEDDYEMYFHVLIDFSGKVIAHQLKTPTGFDELDQRVSLTISSMTFDPVDISTLVAISDLKEEEGGIGYWFVYKFLVTKPDYLR